MNVSRPTGSWNLIVFTLVLIAAWAAGGCKAEPSTDHVNGIAVASNVPATAPAAPQPASPPSVLAQSFHESLPSAKVFPVPAAPPPASIAASQIPGHFVKEINPKPRPVALSVHPAPPSADLLAKQATYLKQWRALQSASLTPDEQEANRAALKQRVLGQ